MHGGKKHDAALRAAWESWCEELKGSIDLIFRDTAPSHEVTRACGARLLARNISLALQFELENADPLNPELIHYFNPLRKQGGDNSDALYLGSPINGQDRYRVFGHRGSAAYFAVTALENGDTPWGGRVVSSLVDDQLQLEPDGSFELIVAPDEHQGNWIRSTPNTWRLTFRQFFADWEREQPMRACIERLGMPSPPPELCVEQLKKGLSSAAHWLRWSVSYWAEMIDKWQARPHEFIEYGELEERAIDYTPGGVPLISYWKVARHQALLVRVIPPKASYWAVEFGDYWWETMDYRYRLCNVNCHYAQLEDDGSLLVVVCHEDPLLPNWLDPCGHEEGYIAFRWIGAESYPRPSCELIDLQDLANHLPDTVKRITSEQRLEQIKERRRGVIKRFAAY